jgi:hypothetical protein
MELSRSKKTSSPPVCVMTLWMEAAANYQLRAMSAGKPRYFTPTELEVIYPHVSREEVSIRAGNISAAWWTADSLNRRNDVTQACFFAAGGY